MSKFTVLKSFTKPDFLKTHKMFEVGEKLTEDDLKGKNIKGLVASGFLKTKAKDYMPVEEESPVNDTLSDVEEVTNESYD